MARVRSDDFARAIMRELKDYTSEVIELVNLDGESIARAGVDELKQISPKRRGRYAKGWTMRSEASSGFTTRGFRRYIIHNPTHYRLTHLLEHGHATRDGGRVPAKPHIAKVEQRVVDRYIKAVEEAIESGH